ncbi:16807_t:CDS:2 [Acaulospora morrowiae]|uniref:16807_t:CDS:1 n=1 Tax=Acaulospora morrowiae TaxID=94023 RepID=A0A9N8UZV3_9GLOM|nr:16807_t:CDS:2 [Acaulospora morrowiae]
MSKGVLDYAFEIGMVVGPVLGYFDQIAKFRRTKSSSGFTLDTSGILLASKIGKEFDKTLLYQSILMIIVQLILLAECLKFRYPAAPVPHRRWFWNWDTYRPYIICLILLTGFLGILSNFLIKETWFVEILGVLALGIEATLPMPQAWQNYQFKSVSGFSPLVLLTWFGGDSFKSFYYINTGSPLQFIICGIIQLTMDSVIVLQFILYGSFKELFRFDIPPFRSGQRNSQNYSQLEEAV